MFTNMQITTTISISFPLQPNPLMEYIFFIVYTFFTNPRCTQFILDSSPHKIQPSSLNNLHQSITFSISKSIVLIYHGLLSVNCLRQSLTFIISATLSYHWFLAAFINYWPSSFLVTFIYNWVLFSYWPSSVNNFHQLLAFISYLHQLLAFVSKLPSSSVTFISYWPSLVNCLCQLLPSSVNSLRQLSAFFIE
jgi:hypothetical protein